MIHSSQDPASETRMDVTAKLLRFFVVDKQLRGLQSRLKSAERFLTQQETDLGQLSGKHSATEKEAKHLAAQAAEHESEMRALDEKSAKLREQMNVAQTNKAYQALLTEINTIKTDRDRIETTALEQMGKVDELRRQSAELANQKEQRSQVRGVAATDRDKRADEIKERVAVLAAERKTLGADLTKETLSMFERLIETRGDEAMAQVDLHDAKRHEYSCGSCSVFLPIEAVNGLLSGGRVTRCVSCSCVLYLDEDFRKAHDASTAVKTRKKAAADQA